MNIEQLRTFVIVADEHSYVRAGGRRFLTQAAVYQHVRQLEREVGVQLVYVHGKRVELTERGAQFYDFANTTSSAHDQLLSSFRQAVEDRQTYVRLGAASYFGAATVVTAERLKTKSENIGVEYRSMKPEQAIQALRAHDIDLAFFGPVFLPTDLEFQEIGNNDIIVVAPADHELGLPDAPPIGINELARYSLVGYSGGSAGAAINAWLDEHEAPPLTYIAQSDSSLAIKTIALSMNAPAFVVAKAVQAEIDLGLLRPVPVRGFEAGYPLYVVHEPQERLSATARIFLRELLKVVAEQPNDHSLTGIPV